MSELKIGTFNILTQSEVHPFEWSRRWNDVVRTIDMCGCGIMGLQEVKKEQLDCICRNCGFSFVGEPRQDPCETDGGEHACIIYRNDMFKVLDSGTFWLSETPETPGSKSWDTAYARICTWARMAFLENGFELNVFNTHLDHRGDVARRRGLELILERIASISKQYGGPCVLSGDFNMEPGHRAMQALDGVLENTGNVTLTPPEGPWETFHNFRDRRPLDECRFMHIDYIYVSPDTRVRSYKVVDDPIDGRLPSDHYPVVAELEL